MTFTDKAIPECTVTVKKYMLCENINPIWQKSVVKSRVTQICVYYVFYAENILQHASPFRMFLLNNRNLIKQLLY